ncbi:hypothetical protein PoB_004504000 [Plakobranchus ocellatus]|uniref:Uncharacterized protein n=1 Tax=Plakobranchus ocellatus TaxID=259542 RepID=A0AAV4BD61_9GAST|nr:hypothetical protein PoB_004504000 [Plakobranchus ocellatus]
MIVDPIQCHENDVVINSRKMSLARKQGDFTLATNGSRKSEGKERENINFDRRCERVLVKHMGFFYTHQQIF